MSNEEIQKKIRERMASKSEEDLIKEDEDILMANYLSEIERVQKKIGFNRKDLAARIQTSASYLTQVFRGDKPLNFHTIAKIQRVLNIKFQVTASPKTLVPNKYYSNMEQIGISNVDKNYTPQYADNAHFLDMHQRLCLANSEKLDTNSSAAIATIQNLRKHNITKTA